MLPTMSVQCNCSRTAPVCALRIHREALCIIGACFMLLWSTYAHAQVNVTMFHNDNTGTGQNLQETKLSPANVNPIQFGKLFSYPVDGFAYAQPLYLTGVNIPGRGLHNLVLVSTQHDTVYAFDADNPTDVTGGGQIWKRSFINPAAGVTTVPTIEV